MTLDDTTSALADDIADTGRPVRFAVGTVLNIGTASDGEVLLTVEVKGSSFQAAWLDTPRSASTFTPPPIGSRVGVLVNESSPIILGVFKGAPSVG